MTASTENTTSPGGRTPGWVFIALGALLGAAIVFLLLRSTGDDVIAVPASTGDVAGATSAESTTDAAVESQIPGALAFDGSVSDEDETADASPGRESAEVVDDLDAGDPGVDEATDADAPETAADPGIDDDADSETATPASETADTVEQPSSVVPAEPSSQNSSPTTTQAPISSTTAPRSTAAPTTAPPATSPPTTAAAPAAPPASGSLYADPYNSAANWARNNANDGRAQTIADDIGSKPIAKWFGDWNGNVQADVQKYVNDAAAADAVPAMVLYNIPERDCGQHSSGGAANFTAYQQWIDQVAAGLGNGEAIIVLEPDAIALNACGGPGRDQAITQAVITIKDSCGGCQVYLDAGHSNWVGVQDMANRLRNSGVLEADGFFTNVSNYNRTSDEAAFGQQVLNALGNPAGLGQVIDVSRNGNGANGEWCDPAGRAVGSDPTLNTGSPTVHAHVWIKVPGEADGCIAGAGQFVPQRAFDLAVG